MATPHASATSSISGAAVPEEILSTCVHARESEADALLAMQRWDAFGLWNAVRGRDAANVLHQDDERSWAQRDEAEIR